MSIFYLMHLLVVLLGGASAGFTAGMLAYGKGWRDEGSVALGLVVALAYIVALEATYFATILRATSEAKLEGVKA